MSKHGLYVIVGLLSLAVWLIGLSGLTLGWGAGNVVFVCVSVTGVVVFIGALVELFVIDRIVSIQSFRREGDHHDSRRSSEGD